MRWRDGSRHRSRAFANLKDAEDYLALLLKATAAPGELSLWSAMQRWLTDVRSTRSHKTYIHYRYIARSACNAIGRDTRLDRVSAEHVARYRDGLAADLTPKTVNNHLRALRAFFNFCRDRCWCPSNPVTEVRFPRYKTKIPRWLTAEEADHLARAARCAPIEIRLAVLLALRAGLRLGELTALRRQNIRDGMIAVEEGKSKIPRMVPLHPEIAEALAAVPINGPYLFPNRIDPSRHRHSHRFGGLIRHWLKQNEFPVGVHGLRHTFGTLLAQAGATMTDLRQLMGHCSAATTEMYLHSSRSRQSELIMRLGSPDRGWRVLRDESA